MLSFSKACRSAAIMATSRAGDSSAELKYGNRCTAASGRPAALHGVDPILRGTVKDPLLKEQEQEMIMGDANPP